MMRSSISYIFLFYFCVLMVVMVVTARFQNSPNGRRIDSGVEPGCESVVKQGYDLIQSKQTTNIVKLFCQLLTKNQLLRYFLRILNNYLILLFFLKRFFK